MVPRSTIVVLQGGGQARSQTAVSYMQWYGGNAGDKRECWGDFWWREGGGRAA